MAAVPGCFRRRVRSSGGRRVLLLTAGAALLASLCVAALAAAGTPARAATANVSGAPYAWGDNSVGELGDGTTTQHDSPEPVTLATGVTATAVSAGTTFSLAIGSDDNLYAWGDNTFGELGDGTTTQHNSPEVITLASGVKPTAISAGELDGMAIGSDGNLYDWGSNTATINGTLATFGELGDGTTTNHDSPEVITLGTGVKPAAISAGTAHSLAIGFDGKLYAWGYNGDGSLGDGATTDQHSPEAITLPAGVKPTAISAGTDSSLAIGSDGKLYAWGDNTFGELGDGTTTQHDSPEVITLAADVKPTAVSAAGFDGMAIGSDGNLYAWGSNTATINGTLATFGELGDGTTTTHDSPEVITLATGVVPVAVSAGLFDTLAIGAACSGTATTAPTCPGTPTTTSDASPTSSDTTGSNSTPTPSDTTRSGATATAGTSAAPSTRAAVAPTNTPAGAAVAVQAAAPLPVGAPATGGGTGTEFSGTVASAGVAVMAAGTGLVVLARRRRRRRPPV